MIESAGGFGFELEPVNELNSITEVTLNGDRLECDRASDYVVVGLINNAHRAAAELRLKLIPVRGSCIRALDLTCLAYVRVSRLIGPQQLIKSLGSRRGRAKCLRGELKSRNVPGRLVNLFAYQNLSRVCFCDNAGRTCSARI